MKIAIVTNFFYLDHLAGTEKYCFELIRSFQKKDHEVIWINPNFNDPRPIKGITPDSIRFAKFGSIDTDIKSVVSNFLAVLKEEEIDVVHFHELGGPNGSSTLLLKAAAELGYKCFVTYHLVYYTCSVGDLRYQSKYRCNGLVDVDRCTRCIVERKIPPLLNFSHNIIKFLLKKPLKNIKRAVEKKMDDLALVEQYATKVVVLTDWFKDVLMLNGFSAEAIQVIKQAYNADLNKHQEKVTTKVNYCFLGRIQKDKGVFDAIKAFKQQGMCEFKLDIYGPDHSGGELMQAIGDTPNIRYKGFVKMADVNNVLAQYKALIIPSIVAEMASLTILESYFANTPVILSDVPGNLEMAKSYGNSILYSVGNFRELAEKIIKVEKNELSFTPKQRFEDHSFDMLASEYITLYNNAVYCKQE